MNKEQTLEQLKGLGLIAVLRGPSSGLTLKMVEALVEGGVKAIEITYTTPEAARVVRQLDRRFGEEIVLGMGTLTRPEQAAEAAEAGARYLVSPMIDGELAEAMVATGRVMMLGALTPGEIVQSHRLGSDVVKLFPGSLGGPDYLKSIHGPFPEIEIMPTGGVSLENVAAWFEAGAVAVGAGSQLCPQQLAHEERFTEITAIARDFVAAVAEALA